MITVQVLEECDIFRGLPPEHLEGMLGLFQEKDCPTGTSLFKEVEEADTFYILLQGMVALRVYRQGKEFTVGSLHNRGESFGWSALVEPRRYTASATCLKDCQVLAASGPALLAHLEKNPGIGFPVMRRLATIIVSRLRESRSHTAALLGLP